MNSQAPSTPRHPVRGAHTAWRQLADEAVLIDLAEHRMYGLNASASFLWHALDGKSSPAELSARLVKGENATEDLEQSVVDFLSELGQLGLLDLQEEPSSTLDPQASSTSSSVVNIELAPPSTLEAPEILWREEIRQAAGTCAFLPAQNPLCNQVPQS